MKRYIFSLVLAFSLLFSVAYAHPGGTDSNGGHYDQSTGQYHYHHGYPAHQHENDQCPYDFDDKTGQNSGTNSQSNNKTHRDSSLKENTSQKFYNNDDINFALSMAFIVFFLCLTYFRFTFWYNWALYVLYFLSAPFLARPLAGRFFSDYKFAYCTIYFLVCALLLFILNAVRKKKDYDYK